MRVFDLSRIVPDDAKGSVLAIGNFDAVHSGHQALIAETIKMAKAQQRPAAVLTFEPHPRRLFRPDDAPFRVTPLSVKLRQLEACGIDCVYVCPFDWTLAALTAEAFINTILKDKIAPSAIVIGHDFHFGQHRAGNTDTLRSAGYQVHVVDMVHDHQHAIVSATRIRGALQNGHIDEANRLLGWQWEIEGEVIHGNKRGRTIGYPTANIALGETIHPAYGVYATEVMIEGENIWRVAATNIGIRPMFEVETGLVEAHIMDYTGDLYGKILRVRVGKKIRDEAKFNSLDELIAQIEKDCRDIRSHYQSHIINNSGN